MTIVAIDNTAGPADLSFGFRPYVESLLSGKGFVDCRDQTCDFATRMPFLPYLIYLLYESGLKSLRAIAIAKDILLSGIVLATFHQVGLLDKSKGISFPFALIASAVLLGPAVIRYAADLTFEESIITELLLAHALIFGFLAKKGHASRSVWISFTLLGVALYTTKSSMLLLVFASTVVLLVTLRKSQKREAAFFASLLVACVVAWGFRNYAVTDHFRINSSWDGNNLYRGNNVYSQKFYPDIAMDQLFQSSQVRLLDGSTVDLPLLPDRESFNGEWEWNDYYAMQAISYLRSEPKAAVRFVLTKSYVFFAQIGIAPVGYTADLSDSKYGTLSGTMFLGSVAINRAFTLFILLIAVLRVRRDLTFVLFSTIYVLAYATPYILGFAVSRHVAPFYAICFGLSIYCFVSEQPRGAAPDD